jgi:ribosome-associated protein
MPKDKQFTLKTEYITLGQLLKAADVASGGGEAKLILAEGGILINGVEDNRRGRKLWGGERVVLPDGTCIRVHAPN